MRLQQSRQQSQQTLLLLYHIKLLQVLQVLLQTCNTAKQLFAVCFDVFLQGVHCCNTRADRPRLHVNVGRCALRCMPFSFSIIGGGGDSLLSPAHAGESQEAALCLPRRAAYVGRRRQGLRLRRSVSRPISCSTTDFPTRMLLTCEGGALLLDSLIPSRTHSNQAGG